MSLAIAFTCNSCASSLHEPLDTLAVDDVRKLAPRGWTVRPYSDYPKMHVLCRACSPSG